MPKLPSLKFNSLLWVVKKHSNYLFLLALLVLLVLEFFVVKNSATTILKFQAQGEEQIKAQGVRVNFNNYEEVIRYIDNAAVYEPVVEPLKNPFNSAQ